MNRHFQKVRDYYFTVSDYINRCGTNKRIVIGSIIWAFVFILWFMTIGISVKKAKNVQANKQQLLVQNIQQKQNQINAFISTTGSKTEVAKYNHLMKERAELNVQIKAYSKQLVPIRRAIEALKTALQKTAQLKLISFENFPDQSLVSFTSTGKTSQKVLLYKQGVRLTLEGSFFNTVLYLKQIEHSMWMLFSDRLIYQVTKYPASKIILELYTLSQQKED